MTLSTAARNAMISALGTLLNSGSIRFNTAGAVQVALIGFGATAFGAPATGVITANAMSADTNAAGGTVASALLRDSGAATVITATVSVTGGAGEFQLSTLTIGAGDTVSVSPLTITQPA